jgi:sporulation protein YlmC with PRC-barrel domain
MKSLKVTSLICGGVLSLTSSCLLAQQSSSTTPGSSSSSSSQSGSSLGTSSQSSSTLGSQSSTYGSHSAMHSGNSVRLSEIMHSAVQSSDGKTIGHIRDLTVDPQSGRIQFAILSTSAAGGASDTSTSGRETAPSSRSSVTGNSSQYSTTGKLIPVPWHLFSQSWSSSQAGLSSSTSSSSTGTTSSSAMGTHHLVLNIDESKLQSAPSFEGSNWNELRDSSFDQRVYSHFGVDRSSALGTSGSSLSGQGSSSTHEHSTLPSSSSPSTSPNK